MEQICDKNKCSGCCACVNTCPKNCISMEYDEYGVLLPVINQDECVNCGACQKVCPINSKPEQRMPQKAYAAWHLNDEVHKKSASGGAAAAFYETAIENGGVCYGTSFDKDLKLTIKAAHSMEEISGFKGSKYVQAFAGLSFREAKKNLEDGKQVVFIGTPCQIAGLQNYLRKDYENLVTVDLICHGVPSLSYLHTHIQHIEESIQKKADNVTFRGEYSFELALYQAGELIYKKYRFLDNYFTGFLNGLFYRPNCYACPYACEKRVADITIGDFWGLGKEAPCSYGLEGGVSVILPNTDKGHQFVMRAKDKLFLDERPLSEAINGNDQLRHPSEKHENYEKFRELYLKDGFELAATACTKEDMRQWKKENRKKQAMRVVNKCKRICKKIVGK